MSSFKIDPPKDWVEPSDPSKYAAESEKYIRAYREYVKDTILAAMAPPSGTDVLEHKEFVILYSGPSGIVRDVIISSGFDADTVTSNNPRSAGMALEYGASRINDTTAGITLNGIKLDPHFRPIPLEFSDDGQQEETCIKVRCDLLQKEDFESAPRDRKPPLDANQLKLHFDVAADELVAAAWVARQIYAVLTPHKVDIIERDPSQNIRLNFKRIAQMHVMHEGKKELVGVVYKVGNKRWYVPLNTTGDLRKDQFNPDVPKAFRLKQTSDVVGKIKGDVYGIGNISLSITKPSGNTQKTLEFAIRQDYRQEIKAGEYVIG